MQITFDIPFVFQANSLQSENAQARSALQMCVKKMSGAKGLRPSVKQTDVTQWTFDVPAFQAASSQVDNALVLNALLRCLIDLNVIYLRNRMNMQIPPLYSSGVVYDRTTVWDTIPALYARQYGDCKSLTCALVAEYAVQGIASKPVFRWIKRGKADLLFHILVQTPSGFEDPSKVLGMNKHENSYFNKTG